MDNRILILSEKIMKTLNIPQVVNIVNQLPHHPTKKWPKRDFNLLQGSTVHHFASEAPIVNQALYHINAHDWVGLAYTIVIRDGQILQTNYLDDRTTHASGGNDISFGVCIGGDLSKRSITDFERRALTGVVLGLKEMFPHLWVKGHNQISKTSCPCTDMNRIRADIESAEELLSYKETSSAKMVRAYALTDRVSSLYNRLNDAKYGKECNRKLMLLAPVEGLETAVDIHKRIVKDLYIKVQNSDDDKEALRNESTRKLNLYADVYEQAGIL